MVKTELTMTSELSMALKRLRYLQGVLLVFSIFLRMRHIRLQHGITYEGYRPA